MEVVGSLAQFFKVIANPVAVGSEPRTEAAAVGERSKGPSAESCGALATEQEQDDACGHLSKEKLRRIAQEKCRIRGPYDEADGFKAS